MTLKWSGLEGLGIEGITSISRLGDHTPPILEAPYCKMAHGNGACWGSKTSFGVHKGRDENPALLRLSLIQGYHRTQTLFLVHGCLLDAVTK